MADWETAVAEKKRELATAIPDAWRIPEGALSGSETKLVAQDAVRASGVLSPAELAITEDNTAAQLLAKIAQRELTAVEVTTAFAKRAAVAQQLTSCLTEMFFERGIERARWLDEFLEENGRVYGPLHGLPISLKDSFRVEGIHATAGFVALLAERPTSNSALVDLLLDAGAVLYVKTNIPQTMMTADSENNIFGRALNPHNTALTAGGSSGGEGALAALRGAPLGVGTDVAGSIRIPALSCGVYGFKPTPGRVPFGNQAPGLRSGLPGIAPAAGPLGQSVADLELFMTAVAAGDPWRYDDDAVPVPWRPAAHQRRRPAAKLRVGVLPEDPAYPLHPPVRRALDEAASGLEAAGHEVIRLPADPARGVSLAQRIAFQYFGLGGRLYGGHLIEKAGEPLVASVAAGSHPFTTEPPVVAAGLELAQVLERLGAARGAYSDAWRRTWLEHDLDVVLAPGAQNTAVAHDTWGLPPYTLMWNLIEYPACIVPFGKASKELDPEPVTYGVPFQPDYDPVQVDGAPCAVQIVAPKFKDEECLWAAGIIDSSLNAIKVN
ncbi:amidase [Durotheca rogersii]|uniref:amidase n=1 Tax=Durotheca rogersii TaxID=419775 RepID=UPI00221EA333|nr:amidase [Durotheca rogersii]KAI5862039.1 amidase [Durotheca rogersii]